MVKNQPSMVQTWTPSERKATTAAAMAKIGDSSAWVPAAGVSEEAGAAGLETEGAPPGEGAALRLTVACGTVLGAVGSVIFAVSFLGSDAEGAFAGRMGFPAAGGAATGAVVEAGLRTGAGGTAADGGLGAEGIDGAAGATAAGEIAGADGGFAKEGAAGAEGTDGGLGIDGAAPGIGRGLETGAGTGATPAADGGFGMDGAAGALGIDGAAGTAAEGGLGIDGAATGTGTTGLGIAETAAGAGTEGLRAGAVGTAEGGFGMPAATGLGIPGAEAGFIPGGGGGTTALRACTGLGGRLIIAASPEPGVSGAPSRRLGRTMRTVSFFGSDIVVRVVG